MAHLNPDAPAFNPAKFASAQPTSDGDAASSFKPNPDAPAFRPNPEAPAFQPKPASAVPILDGFKLKRLVPPPITAETPGSTSATSRSPLHPGGGGEQQPSLYPPGSRAHNAPATGPVPGTGPQSRRSPPQPGTPDPAPGSHFTVNGSDSAAQPPPRGWHPPHPSSFPHVTNVSPLPRSVTASAEAAAAPSSNGTPSLDDQLGRRDRAPPPPPPPAANGEHAQQQPPIPVRISTSPTTAPAANAPSKAMNWVPPHHRLLARLGKGAAPSLLPASATRSPLADPQPPATAVEGPSDPTMPAAAAPKPVSSPPAAKGWLPPHQRIHSAKPPAAKEPGAKASPPAAPQEDTSARQQVQEQSPPPPPPSAPEREEPPLPAPRTMPTSIPPRISSAPMAKAPGASLRPSLALGPKKSALGGLPSRPPVPPGPALPRPAPPPAAHVDPASPSDPVAPQHQQQTQPAPAPASPPPPVPPPAATSASPIPPPPPPSVVPSALPGAVAMSGAPSPSVVKGPPMGMPGTKTWQPPQYGRRPGSAKTGAAATSPASGPASPLSAPPPPAPASGGYEPAGNVAGAPPPPPPQQLARPPMHHHHHHHHHHQMASSLPGGGTGPGPGALPLSRLSGAPSYVPQNWQPPQQRMLGHTAAALPQARPTPDNPLVVLIYGCRGAGKTTQAAALAQRYNLLSVSSGKWFKEDKKPFEELRATVCREFGPGVARKYNGIVLDRFIVTSEIDAYYIQSALEEGGLPVPMAIWLQVDPVVGMQRAEARGDDKVANDHWRAVEQRAQAAAADRVYGVIGSLESVDTDRLTEAEVTKAINRYVDLKFPHRSRNIRLPDNIVGDQATPCPLIQRHEQFMELTKGIHLAVGNISGRTDSAPLSTIGGYVDKSYFAFANKAKRSLMISSHVTLKVDGQRFIVGKHKTYGYVGLPFLFQSAYDFNALFDELPFPDRRGAENVTKDDSTRNQHNFEVLLDCELAVDAVNGAILHVIDFVYFYGMRAKKAPFSVRYDLLQDWFFDMRDNSTIAAEDQPVQLKEYVPVKQLGELLPSLEAAPFPIDGLVFQHANGYRYGVDKCLLKWKPQEMCTADFRLAGGFQRDTDHYWQFDLCVSDSNDQNTVLEVPFPLAIAVFTPQEMNQYKLRDSVIVELYLFSVDDQHGVRSTKGGNNATNHRTVWHFHRLRQDKPAPNKLSIVKEIVDLQHLTYPELLRLCSELDSPAGK